MKGKRAQKVAVALILILFAAAALRFFDIGGESLWYDETYTVKAARLPLQDIVTVVPLKDFNPPLYFFIMHGWVRLAGYSETALRIPSAVFGLAAVVLLFFVGRELGDEYLGLAAAFLSSFSLHLIRYSQEARTYSLFLLLSLTSYYLFIRIIRRGETGRTVVAYSVCTTLLLYTHYHAVFLVLAQTITAALLWPRLKKRTLGCAAAVAVATVAFIPWIFKIRTQLRIVATWNWWMEVPTIRDVFSLFTAWAAAPAQYYSGKLTFVPFVLTILTAALALVGFLAWSRTPVATSGTGWPRPVGWTPSEETIILTLWLLVPILAPFVYSRFGRPIFVHRYIIGAAPAFYLLAARGLQAFNRPWRVLGLFLIILSLSVPGLTHYYRHAQKDRWNEVARLIELEGRQGDLVVLASAILQTPFGHYYKGPLAIHGVENWNGLEKIFGSLCKAIFGHQRLWFVKTWDDEEKAFRVLNDLIPQGPEAEHKFTGVRVLLYTIPP